VVGDPGENSGLATGKAPPQRIQPDLIPGLIRRWADTLASRNVGGHIALYAGRLSRFNGMINPTREAVRMRKEQEFAGLRAARNLQLRDLRVVHPTGSDVASATFAVDWTEGGVQRSHRYRLTFRRSGGNWLIYSEERLG
jgi:hypothetical protein